MSQNNKQLVRAHFSRHAEQYAQHAIVQKKMLDQLWHVFLAESAERMEMDAAQVLDVGCGPGDAFERIHQHVPIARYVGLDLSATMLEQARKTIQECVARIEFARGDAIDAPVPIVEWVEGDAEQFDFESHAYDLIISNATVQWFNQPQRTLQKMVRALKPGGALLFSTFGAKTFQELHHAAAASGNDARRIGPKLYGLNVWLQWLNDICGQMFRIESRSEKFELAFPSALAFLKHIQATGANEASDRVWTPRQLRALLQAYEELASPNRNANGIVATYEVFYFWVLNKNEKK